MWKEIVTWRAVGPWTASSPTQEYRSNTDVVDVVTLPLTRLDTPDVDVIMSAASAAVISVTVQWSRDVSVTRRVDDVDSERWAVTMFRRRMQSLVLEATAVHQTGAAI